jgi:hypothetical protein
MFLCQALWSEHWPTVLRFHPSIEVILKRRIGKPAPQTVNPKSNQQAICREAGIFVVESRVCLVRMWFADEILGAWGLWAESP